MLNISLTHFESLVWQAKREDVARLNQSESLRLPDLELSRRATVAFWAAAITLPKHSAMRTIDTASH